MKPFARQLAQAVGLLVERFVDATIAETEREVAPVLIVERRKRRPRSKKPEVIEDAVPSAPTTNAGAAGPPDPALDRGSVEDSGCGADPKVAGGDEVHVLADVWPVAVDDEPDVDRLPVAPPLLEEPATSPSVPKRKRPRIHRSRPRAQTIPLKKLTRRRLDEIHVALNLSGPELTAVDENRPRIRRDCLPGGCNEARPCPYVACSHHLYLDVDEESGAVKFNFPEIEPWEMVDSCSLDLADRGGMTLDEVGPAINITRERIRQIELSTFPRLRHELPQED